MTDNTSNTATGPASSCIIPAASNAAPKASVAIPVAKHNAGPASNIETVQENGVVRHIILRCECSRTHRIQVDYEPSTATEG